MSIEEEILKHQRVAAYAAFASKIKAIKSMAFSGYGAADDEIWNGIISPMMHLGIESKVWSEIYQHEYALVCAP
jgi:hypothetical protein